MALVLSIGVDPALMRTRALLLQQAGHKVVSASSEADLIEACQRHKFEVAVIGQMVSKVEKERTLQLIRQHCPSAKTLELFQASTGKVLTQADAWLEVPVDAPGQLAQRVATLATT